MDYAERLQSLGHAVTLLGPETYEWMTRLRAGKRLRMLIGYSRAALAAVRSDAYDVVELWGAEGWWAMDRLSRRARRPLLVARSNGLEPHFEANLERAGLAAGKTSLGRGFDFWQKRERAFRRADLLTIVSQFDRSFAVARGYQPDDRLLTLENPLPDDWLGQPFKAERPRVVGFFGSSTPNKGGPLLLQAIRPLLESSPEWTVRFVGSGDLDLGQTLPAALAGRVQQIPFVSDRARLRAVYQDMAIVAMPSAYESFGLVAAEAMACGCLLVASNTGFAAGLSRDLEARVVAERNVEAWSHALLAATADEARRREIARAGHARVQQLRWTPTVARLAATYEQRLAQRN